MEPEVNLRYGVQLCMAVPRGAGNAAAPTRGAGGGRCNLKGDTCKDPNIPCRIQIYCILPMVVLVLLFYHSGHAVLVSRYL